MSTIETSGALRPGTTDTPLDERTRVSSLADIAALTLPYVGQIIYCIETAKYYKITSLKPKLIGALNVTDAAVDTYEELHVTTSELNSIIVRQVMNNPSILTFLEELIASKLSGSGDTPEVPEEIPYTYPEGVSSRWIAITLPEERYFTSSPDFYNSTTYVWGEETVNFSVKRSNGTNALSSVVCFDGINLVYAVEDFRVADRRIAVQIASGVSGTLEVSLTAGGVKTFSTIVEYNGIKVPRYFTRPVGEGNWQFKINGSVVPAEYWEGSSWHPFPGEGLGSAYAGSYIRPVSEPEFPSLACWSNAGTDGAQFLYIV